MLVELQEVGHFGLSDGKFESARFILFDVGADDLLRVAVRETGSRGEQRFAERFNCLAFERAPADERPAL